MQNFTESHAHNIQQMKSRSMLVLQLLEELSQSAILTLQNSLKLEKLAAHQCIWSTDQDKERGKEINYNWLLQPAADIFANSCPNYRGK